MRIFLLTMLAFVLAGCASTPQVKSHSGDKDPIVILVGIDGLRWDAIDRHPAPTLNALAKDGVRAAHMTPVMPSLTFVNFYSIATGLHAENTGITSNMAYSRKFGEIMDRDLHGESRWWGGEPIWVTAEKQGVTSAAMFWLGSEAEINGKRPTYWNPYEHYKPNGERVDQVLEWLAMPEDKRPGFVTLYFSIVDSAAHRYGPESAEEGNAIKEVDGLIADLQAGIKKLGLEDQANIIIVSDHGMTEVGKDNLVYLDDYINFSDVQIPAFEIEAGAAMEPFVYIIADGEKKQQTYNKLKAAHPALDIYKYEDLPADWHMNNYERTGDLFALAKPGWLLFGRSLKSRYPNPPVGMHGYDRFHKDMQATFLADGPAFKSGLRAKPLENVEVYGLIAEILGLTPAQYDGDINNVRYMLKD